MTNDLLIIGVSYYVGRVLFCGFFLVVTIAFAFPWVPLIALWLWWLYRKAVREAALDTASNDAPAPRETFGRPVPNPQEPNA